MKTNVSIELNEAQRNHLSRLIEPAAAKRLATRADINEFVHGCIAAALELDLNPPVSIKSPVGKLAGRLNYWDALAKHLDSQGNTTGAAIARRTKRELEGAGA